MLLAVGFGAAAYSVERGASGSPRGFASGLTLLPALSRCRESCRALAAVNRTIEFELEGLAQSCSLLSALILSCIPYQPLLKADTEYSPCRTPPFKLDVSAERRTGRWGFDPRPECGAPSWINVTPSQAGNVIPTRNTQKPPFYQEIEGASQWAVDSEQWEGFVRDAVQMPATMIPAVREAIRQQRWKIAPDPLASIRTAAYQEAKRMGLR